MSEAAFHVARHLLIELNFAVPPDAARLEPIRTQITDAMKIYERDVLKTVTWHP
jgi:hypothetical protein